YITSTIKIVNPFNYQGPYGLGIDGAYHTSHCMPLKVVVALRHSISLMIFFSLVSFQFCFTSSVISIYLSLINSSIKDILFVVAFNFRKSLYLINGIIVRLYLLVPAFCLSNSACFFSLAILSNLLFVIKSSS